MVRSWGRGVVRSWGGSIGSRGGSIWSMGRSRGVVRGGSCGGSGVTFSRHAVDCGLMVTGAQVLIKCRAVAAVECVLLAILVTEVIDLASCLGVSVVPVGVFPTAVKCCVSLRDGYWECLDSLHFIGLLLQQDWAGGGVGGGGVGGRGWDRGVGQGGGGVDGGDMASGAVAGLESQGGGLAGVILTHGVLQHLLGQLGGHGRHHALHLDALGHPQARRVNHVQLCA